MKFEFATATRIIFGPGSIQQAGPLAAQIASSAFVVTGRSIERAKPLLEQLSIHRVKYVTFSVPAEPTTAIAKQAVRQARQTKAALVIAVGGGSALDTAKVVASMLTNSGELEDYLEVVGKGKPLTQAPIPYIAIPTTAGTGAEVTNNAVLGVPQYHRKVSMRSPLMLPYLALVDPELTYSMPPALTASTGLDALTQLLEVYVSSKANPLTDAVCKEGLKRAARSLRLAYENGANHAARQDMALASLFSGLALANAKLGAVHGLAGPLGGLIAAPHGVICARLLPCVMHANVNALLNREPHSPALARFDDIAQILTGSLTAKALDAVVWVSSLCSVLKVPPLDESGLKEKDFPAIVADSGKSSSMKGNPIELTDRELIEVLKKACKQNAWF
jgi:alcohol dehydrogenase class IV